MDKRLLDILCCPVSKQPLRPLSGAQLAIINRAVAGGDLLTTDGRSVGQALVSGLLTQDGKVIYRIEDEIPVMLAEEAIGTQQLTDFPV